MKSFPRPRGDGPDSGAPSSLMRLPRPRGDGPYGCLRADERFPRPRGDGPWAPTDAQHDASSPPPTRGWSPTPARRQPRPACLPRPRGDGPCNVDRGNGAVDVSPAHAGMVPTGSALLEPLTAHVSPAHAGMVPIIAGSAHGEADVSPAHAGMVPVLVLGDARARCLPRPRGDGPLVERHPDEAQMSPPPTRGWSRGLARNLAVAKVSPAHAGMVPMDSGGNVSPR